MSNLIPGGAGDISPRRASSPTTFSGLSGGAVLPGDTFSAKLLRWDAVAAEVRATLPSGTPVAQEIDRRVLAKGGVGREGVSGWAAWSDGTIWQGVVETPLAPVPDGKWRRSGPPSGTGRIWQNAVMRRRTVAAAIGAGSGRGSSSAPDDATALEVLPGELARMFPRDATGSVWREVTGRSAVREVVEMRTRTGDGILTLRAERRARRETELARAEWQAVTASTREAPVSWRYDPGAGRPAVGGPSRRPLERGGAWALHE